MTESSHRLAFPRPGSMYRDHAISCSDGRWGGRKRARAAQRAGRLVRKAIDPKRRGPFNRAMANRSDREARMNGMTRRGALALGAAALVVAAWQPAVAQDKGTI